MTTPADPSRPAAPSVREIAALTARLREITAQGRDVDPADRAQFLADKDALIARITATETERGRAAVRERYDAQNALADAVRAGAEHPGYVLVGPSARTWLRDPDTGQPAAPVSEHEHRAVRELLNREELDTTDPEWVTGPDGHSNVHSVVYPTPHTTEDAAEDDTADDAARVDEAGDPGAVVHTFDPADAYTAAEIGAIAAAHARGDDAEVARLEAGRPSMVPDRAAAAGEPVEVEMPEWMRERARTTEVEIAAGTYEPGPPDDPERIAARLADLRAAAGTAVGDAGRPGAPERDDPAWWAPTMPGEAALSHQDVAAELTGRGFTPEQARAAVTEYLDDTSDRIGVSVHQWAMDSHDVEAIAHTHRPPVPVPEQLRTNTAEQGAEQPPDRGDAAPDYAGERHDWEQVRGDDPRSYEQMMSDAAGALTTHQPADVEGDRREQLVRWHTDDAATGPDRGDDDVIGSDWDDEPMIFEGRPW